MSGGTTHHGGQHQQHTIGSAGGAVLPPLENELDLDGGEEGDEGDKTIYCICERVSFGEMIGCDGSECEREWVNSACEREFGFLTELLDIFRSLQANGPDADSVCNSPLPRNSSTSAVSDCKLFPRASGIAQIAVERTRRRNGDRYIKRLSALNVICTRALTEAGWERSGLAGSARVF